MTAPGQTAAISVFTDPLIAELGISRNALSTSYLIGTLGGAGAMPLVGRALDRFGVGRTMTVIAAVFGAVLIGLSFVTGILGLTAGFIGIRMAGQGALGLAATTAVAVHVTHRRGLALGITSAVGSAGISLAPVVLERLISAWGMDTVWLVEGLLVWAVVLPLALLVFSRTQPPRRMLRAEAGANAQADAEALADAEEGEASDEGAESEEGEASDEGAEPGSETEKTRASQSEAKTNAGPGQPPAHSADGHRPWTVAAAVGTPMFWAIAAAVAASGMLSTALNFHQIAALGEQGLSPAQAALNFVPQAIATMTITIGVGALTDRIAPKFGLVFAMVLLGGALLSLSLVSDAWTAMGYGILLGASGGAVRTVEAAAFAHYFGTTHLGAIRGLVTTISVSSTAVGPLALSLGQQALGSYGAAATVLAVIPAIVIVAALFVRPPARS